MEVERSTYIMIILAALFLMLGTLTAHAQTATPTPGVCSINTLPSPPNPPNRRIAGLAPNRHPHSWAFRAATSTACRP